MFSSQNRAQIMQVRYQLYNAKKADMEATAYYHKMKGYAETIASLGHPLTDEEILGYMLAGLGAEYESLVTSITTRDEPISLASFFVHLLSMKVRIQRNTSTSEIQSLANAASRQFTENRNGGRGGPSVAVTVAVQGQRAKSAASMVMMRCIAISASIMPTSPTRTASALGAPLQTLPTLWILIGIWIVAPMIISPAILIA
jgi:hypothetical protein